MKKLILLSLACIMFVHCAIRGDIVHKVPGYADTFQTEIYAGYLNTSSQTRKMHYVFVEAASKVNNSDPVTLWLNGGPGCSSLLGFLQEIGPFYMQDGVHYKVGDNLTQNPHSWHKISNLLFIESPAGVGYSLNKNSSYEYNDINTANDNFNALLNFFQNYPEYSKNHFWIAGESYAGKYIPDLAVLIDYHNRKENVTKIDLKGFLIGNGVMSFRDESLDKSQTEYMIDHDFVDPQLVTYYQRSCLYDAKSAGCQYFKKRFEDNIEEINPYSVYDYCFYNDSFIASGDKKKFHSQTSILRNLADNGKFDPESEKDFNGATCVYFDGLYEYFNAHVKQFHGQEGMTWNGPCDQKISQKYIIDISGSMYQYQHLLGEDKYHMVLYNGDWDDVVPFTDTIKNMEKLNLKQSYLYTPFFVEDQHAGFIQLYSGVTFVLVKGASHMVPQSKRAEAYELFHTTINSQGSQQKFKELMLAK